jgi:hypothetical protein
MLSLVGSEMCIRDSFKPLPEGTVKVGTPTVIEPTKPAKN